MLSQVDDDGSGSIEFPEFLKVIEAQKEAATAQNDESDLIDAFVAMGGMNDKSGHVEAEKLRRTIKAFELTVDIDRLIDETDADGSGEIEYDEFKGVFARISACGLRMRESLCVACESDLRNVVAAMFN